MSHEINELAPGVHSFVSARQDAWHKLGITLEGTFTAEEALEKAHLANWNVRKRPVYSVDENGEHIAIDNRFATIYDNPVTGQVQYLGVVGSYYEPIQNEANADILNAIVDESGAHFETAGSVKGGRETFVSMKMPQTMMVGGEDPVDLYLVAMNSHDGTSNFRLVVTPVRVVCANTIRAAVQNAKSSFSVRHTGSSKLVIQEAREALDLTFAYTAEFQAEADKMIDSAFGDLEFEKYMIKVFEMYDAKSKRQENAWDKRAEDLWNIWYTAPTMEGISQSRWGAYQAVTEYIDHVMDIKGDKNKETRSATRAVMSPVIASVKNRAFELARV